MKLRAKINQIVTQQSKAGKEYTKVKLTVEEGHDQQTGMVFWRPELGKLPQPGDIVMVEFGVAAGEYGDLLLKVNTVTPAAAAVVAKVG